MLFESRAEVSRLKAEFEALGPVERRRAHEHLARRALETWNAFVQKSGPISYVDSVVGTAQAVDDGLPAAAVNAVATGSTVASVDARYGEPITAMQDLDLELPDHAQLAYYAVYNYFRKYALGADIEDWLVVAQAMSSEDHERDALDLLERALAASLR